jgi:hypothetical protein
MQALEEKRRLLADKYAGTAAIAALRGMNKSTQTALYKNAQLGVISGEYEDINEGVRKQLQIQAFQKLPHPEVVKSKIIKQYNDEYKKADANDVYASNKAELDYQIKNLKKLPSMVKEEDLAGDNRYLQPSDVTKNEDGSLSFSKGVLAGKKKAFNKDINKVFINPINKKFYRFNGTSFEPIVE